MKKILLLILMILSLSACSNATVEENDSSANTESSDEATSYLFAMDTIMSLTAYGEGADAALASVTGAIENLESAVSVTDENSDIYKLNASSSAPIEVADDTAEIISRTLDICASTNGALDITIYPVMQEWGFTNYEYKVPSYNVLQDLLRYVDYNKVTVDGNTVTLENGVAIDLGSVTKGYTGDMAAEILEDAGIESAVLSLGGNVRLIGSKPNGEDWKVGVQHPLDDSVYMAILEVSDKSVITSGGYNRYFEEDGQTYWHIINPYTGYPANSGVISATIIGEDGLMCDALSTATFVMGINKSFDYWRSRQDFDMILITENKNIYITSGIADNFTLLPDYAEEYKIEVVS